MHSSHWRVHYGFIGKEKRKMKNVKKLAAEKLMDLAMRGECKSIPISFHEVEITPELRRAIRMEREKKQK